jgi:transmembrane sensor
MEVNDGNQMDDLLVKKMLGEASAADQYVIETWLGKSAENRRYFSHFDLIWNQSKKLAIHSKVDENAAWDRFQARVHGGTRNVEVIRRINWPFAQVWKMAAVLVLLAGLAWLTFLSTRHPSEHLTSRTGETTKRQTLPDGSVVTLNRNSSISYPANFSGNSREVAITGEAFFDVKPDKAKPFLVKINDVTVRVVGTSFNIKTSPFGTEVVVETGVVEVLRDKRRVQLTPRQQVTVSDDGKTFAATEIKDLFYNYYRTKKLVCDDTPLWRLVEILSEIYGVQIEVGDAQLKQRALNTTFDGLTLDATLALVCDTFNIKVVREGSRIILK